MILEALATALAGGGLGGITGLVGTLITKWDESKKRQADIELQRLQNEQTKALLKMEQAHAIQLASLTAASQERLADINAQARADETASLDFRASQDSDRARYLAPEAQGQSRLARWAMGLVDFARGMIRPGATVYSFVLLTMLLLWVMQLYSEKQLTLTPDQAQKLALEIIGTTTYLATTCTTWWFGVRGTSRGK